MADTTKKEQGIGRRGFFGAAVARRVGRRGRRVARARPRRGDGRRAHQGPLPGDRACRGLLSHQPLLHGGLSHARQTQILRTASRGGLAAFAQACRRQSRRSPQLSAERRALPSVGLPPWAPLGAGTVRRAEAGHDRLQPARRGQDEHLHPLLGGLHGQGRGPERRLGRSGARLGQPDQPRHALRQGRIGARARAWRPPPEVPDEEGRRRVGPHLLGPGASTRSATRCWRSARPSGADSAYLLGSAKFSNEGAYLFRKFAAFWGTNNVDHQARICHSTTVAGVANTWGYGAMTNSYNDIRNSKTIIFMGSNAAEAHPVSLQHILTGKETQPRQRHRHRPALHPHGGPCDGLHPHALRAPTSPSSGGSCGTSSRTAGRIRTIIDQRVWGMDQVREEVKKYTPDEVERITGIPEARAQARRARPSPPRSPRPSSGAWAARSTPWAPPTCATYCNLLLATGNVGCDGHRAPTSSAAIATCRARRTSASISARCLATTACPKVAGSTGRASGTCPTSISSRRFDEVPAKGGRDPRDRKANMEMAGIPSTRWFDATTLDAEDVDQRDNIKAMIVFGHGGNTVPRMGDSLKGMNALDLLVVADPHPTTFAALHDRTDNTYLLPISTQFECDGSRTASNRSVQWGEKVVDPIFESDNDYAVIYRLSQKLGLRRRDVQALRDGAGQVLDGADGRIDPARDQPRRLVDRLYRAEPGADQGAYGQPGQVRPGDAARACRCGRSRGRLLRSAMAVLGHAGAQASGHAYPLQPEHCR